MWIVWHPLIWGHCGAEEEQTVPARKMFYYVEVEWMLDLQEYCKRQSALKKSVLSQLASRVSLWTPGTWWILVHLVLSQLKWHYEARVPVSCSSSPVDVNAAVADGLLADTQFALLWVEKVWARNAGSLFVLLLLLLLIYYLYTVLFTKRVAALFFFKK